MGVSPPEELARGPASPSTPTPRGPGEGHERTEGDPHGTGAGGPPAPVAPGPGYRWLVSCAAAWAFMTILLGADVTFTGTGLSCPDWPGCFPSELVPSLTGLSAIEFLHRISALLLTLLTFGVFLFSCLRRDVRVGLRNLSASAFLLVVAQALLGGAIIETQEATPVVIAHLGLGTLLFGVLLLIAFVANLPYLPARWQRALLGSLTPVKAPREELDRAARARGTPSRGRDGAAAPAAGRAVPDRP